MVQQAFNALRHNAGTRALTATCAAAADDADAGRVLRALACAARQNDMNRWVHQQASHMRCRQATLYAFRSWKRLASLAVVASRVC